MKKFATIVILSLIMTGCISPAEARTPRLDGDIRSFISVNRNVNFVDKMVYDYNFNARSISLSKNTEDLTNAINNTKKQIGKTWYVFSGSTPKGWDCSGLVRWTYSHLDFDFYHGATAQMNYGKIVQEPKYGDLVGFKYHASSSRYYHIGIYISEDMMLHSGGKRGDKTEITSISKWAKNNGKSKTYYSRIVETN
jgi:cell wall-associated NlpC family hydrolase